MRLITEQRAKEIAANFHGGQWSALYAFASTGTASDEAIEETSAEYNGSTMEVDKHGTWYQKMSHTAVNRAQLRTLLNYLTSKHHV